jgi:hypothetical protein
MHALFSDAVVGTVELYTRSVEDCGQRADNLPKAYGLHELGDVQWQYATNVTDDPEMRLLSRASAAKHWESALDVLTSTFDLLGNWTQMAMFADGNEGAVLEQLNVWGCIQGLSIASKLAISVHTRDLTLRLQTARLAAKLVLALFHASLPHPQVCIPCLNPLCIPCLTHYVSPAPPSVSGGVQDAPLRGAVPWR